jgi:hypothetical protein
MSIRGERRLRHRRIRLALAAAVMAGIISGCGSWQYTDLLLPDALRDVRTESQGDVSVSVAILDDDRAAAHFGVDLGASDIQAIWIRVRNASDVKLWFLRAVLDPDFYPVDEVAMIVRRSVPGKSFPEFQQRLRDESMHLQIQPRTVTQGFVFAPRAIGGRYVDVRLVQDAIQAEARRERAAGAGERPLDNRDLEFRFGFALPLPDGIFDYERLDPDNTYPGMELPDLDEAALRTRLAALPCCSMGADNESPGDPLNIVILGGASDVLNSLSRAGWSFTHRITARSVTRLAGAALSGDSYPVAPVSPLNAFGRKQDFALQRARTSIAQRNHMRVWLAPFTHRGEHVWVGQISRDIGIKLTDKSSSMITHIIDPEVDQAREYLLQSLLAGGFVQAFGFVGGAQQASRDSPAYNLADDPYFSDGQRLVVLLSPQPVPYGQVRSLMWGETAAPVAEGQSTKASRNVWSIDSPRPQE